MNEYDWDYQDDDDDGPIDPKTLPQKLRKVIASAKKEAKEAKDEADILRKQVREINLSTVLKSKGVSEKVARLIPADVTSAEAIDTWLSEFGDVFGTPAASPPAANQAPATNGQQFIENAAATVGPSAEEIAAMQRMQGTTGTALPFGGRIPELQLKLDDPNLTEEQLDQMIKSGGL